MIMKKKIYQVGGCVRDRLLGIKYNDIDYIAVGFKPEEFSHLKSVGKDFPVFLDDNGNEIALARLERKNGNGYNAFECQTENVTLKEDLSRRDLTINSIAYDEEKNEFIDPYNGINDLKNKILKHTTCAFQEDPLRVLRIARFKAKFSEFKIHENTKKLILTMKKELKYLQPDRVYKEVQKVIKLKNSEIFFQTLIELDVLDTIFPNIYNLTLCTEENIYHLEDNVFIHTMMVLKELGNEDETLKYTALYHDIAKPMCYKKNITNSGGHDNIELVEPLIDIQLPNKIKKDMLIIIKNHLRIFLFDEMKLSKKAQFIESFRKDINIFKKLLIFAKADTNGRITNEKKVFLNEELLIKIFNEISNYSPKEWINSQNKQVSGEAIKNHIHHKNMNIIKKILNN
jgi:tRNA nucleotidyltransferase (CCA-adding enzyme)